jgi:hypothetical protein
MSYVVILALFGVLLLFFVIAKVLQFVSNSYKIKLGNNYFNIENITYIDNFNKLLVVKGLGRKYILLIGKNNNIFMDKFDEKEVNIH